MQPHRMSGHAVHLSIRCVCGCKMIYIVNVLKSEKVLAYEHMRKASDPELSSWTLLIGSYF